MLTVDDVVDTESLMEYARQQIGTPLPKAKERPAVNKVVKTFFEQYPDATHQCLTDVVRWAQIKKRHYDMKMLMSCWRYAYEDGFMVIMENAGTNDDETLRKLLPNVRDPEIRKRMTAASTAKLRDQIYQDYLALDYDADSEAEPEGQSLMKGVVAGEVVQYRISMAEPWRTGTAVGVVDDDLEVRDGGRTIRAKFVRRRMEGDWRAI